MPKRTYITREKKALLGHKPMKDRRTLLLCGEVSGDFKVKPLLVYQQEVAEELSSEEEKRNEGSITTADIKELLGYGLRHRIL
jgi:hypothetical protein